MTDQSTDLYASLKTWATSRQASIALGKVGARTIMDEHPGYLHVRLDGRCVYTAELPAEAARTNVRVVRKMLAVGRCADGSLVVEFLPYRPRGRAIKRDSAAHDVLNRMGSAVSWLLEREARRATP